MKKIIYSFISLCIIFSLYKCAVYNDIYSEYDHSTDFTKYKTFAWLPDSGVTARKDSFRNTAYDNDVIRNNAKNYITHQLADRGLVVHVDSPDALFQLILLNQKQQRIVTSSPAYYPMPYYYGAYHFPYYLDGRTYYPYYYPYYDYYTYYGWGCADFYCSNYSYKQTYVKGTIIINMYDRKQKKMIWTASAEGNIYDPNTIKEEVAPAIKKMMKEFPIKPGGKSNKSDMYVKR